jgi:carbamoyl-phosphate synthase large subunit
MLVGGIMEHIEQAGVHSGDSACSLPPYSLDKATQDELRKQMHLMAKELDVIGLMNAQFAIQNGKIFVLEVNPRASRTVPFVSKATSLPLAKIAARVMVGKTLKQQGYTTEVIPPYYSVKEPVFPFNKFPNSDPILGPEMKSTGEAMGVGNTFGEAYYKAKLACHAQAPMGGNAIISVRDADKAKLPELGRQMVALGFKLFATEGTAKILQNAGVECTRINKMLEGRPHIVDLIKNGEMNYIVNTTEGKQAIADSYLIRRAGLQKKVPYTTTIAGAFASCAALRDQDRDAVESVQSLHKRIKG